MSFQKFELLDISELIETEEFYLDRAKKLAKEIKDYGFWTVPIAIEVSTKAIMDGHHRLYASKLLGLKRVPCVSLSYIHSNVILRSWKNNDNITIEDFFSVIKNKKKFPAKTTRHIFKPPIQERNIPLDFLY
tara:strand:- start:603 stop:998 length:396 start_codon:yes stop_codon:yes gene_type:complete